MQIWWNFQQQMKPVCEENQKLVLIIVGYNKNISKLMGTYIMFFWNILIFFIIVKK